MQAITHSPFLALALSLGLGSACSQPAGESENGSSSTGQVDTSGSTGGESTDTGEASSSTSTSSSESSSSSAGDTEGFDGYVPVQGMTIDEVVVNQGVAVTVWTADDGLLAEDDRNGPLLQNRTAAVFVRFSVDDDWEPREITARLHFDGETFEVTRMVDRSSEERPGTWFNWLLEPTQAVPSAQFQVELVEPASEPLDIEPVVAPLEGPGAVGFEGPDVALDVMFMPVTIESETCNETREPSKSELEEIETLLIQTLPVQTLNLTLHDQPAVVQLEEPGDGMAIVEAIAGARGAEDVPPTTLVVGIAPACAGPFGSGLYRGSFGTTHQRTGMIINNPIWLTKNLEYLIALMFDRRRVQCPDSPASNLDAEYPYDDGTIGTWGFGILDHQLRAPDETYSVISNCSPSWTSDYGWRIASESIRFLNGL